MSGTPRPEALPITPLAAALAYARVGWHVLPLEPRSKQPLGRLVPNGQNDASTDLEVISGWFKKVPDAGVGIYLQPSGLAAIDIDPRNGGLSTMEIIEAEHGPLDSDVLAYTGGGGEHRVFSLPAGMAGALPGKLGPGVDLKLNGYIAVHPTVHPSGRRYEWEASSDPLEGIAPTPLPDWLRSYVRPASNSPQGERFVTVTGQQWAEIDSALSAIDSDDRDTWVRVGQALHATGELDRAFKTWDAWSQTSTKYDPRDSLRVWRSFRGRGISGTTYRSIFAMAREAGWRAPRLVTTSYLAANTPAPEDLLVDYDTLERKAGSLSWVVKRLFPAKSVGVVYGASGTFKSFCMLDAALHIAHGLQWLGQRTKRSWIVYVAAEGDVGLLRRVKAWHKAHKLNPRDAWARYVIVPIEIMRDAVALRAAIEARGIEVGLVVIDTLSQTYTGDENSSNDMAAYMRAVRAEISQPLGACATIIHHTGHSEEKRPRGSSAIRSNTDFLFLVTRNEKEMLVSFDNQHQKDGELFAPTQFILTQENIGKDADGDEITSLVATMSGDVGQLVETVKSAGRNGKGSNRAMLLDVAVHGELVKTVRDRFYDRLGDKDQATKRRAWHDCINWAQDAQILAVEAGSLGRILRRDPVDN